MWGTENIWLITLLGGMAFASNVLYMLGGTEGFTKALRRFVGSAVLALAASIGAIASGVWMWPYLLFFPLLAIGFSLGYGGEEAWKKVLKRTVFALGVLSCTAVGLWMTAFSPMGWVISALALITGITSVALGVLNPFNNAPLEQFIISQVLTLYVPFWAFVSRG